MTHYVVHNIMGQFFQAPTLNFAHADNGASQALPDTPGVRPENAIHDPREVIDMRDVVDLRILRGRHGTLIPVPMLVNWCGLNAWCLLDQCRYRRCLRQGRWSFRARVRNASISGLIGGSWPSLLVRNKTSRTPETRNPSAFGRATSISLVEENQIRRQLPCRRDGRNLTGIGAHKP
jgi:hypothetical protein